MSKFYEIRVPIERKGQKKHWLRVGSATAFQRDREDCLACTIEAMPLNWDGEFFLFPSKQQPPGGGE